MPAWTSPTRASPASISTPAAAAMSRNGGRMRAGSTIRASIAEAGNAFSSTSGRASPPACGSPMWLRPDRRIAPEIVGSACARQRPVTVGTGRKRLVSGVSSQAPARRRALRDPRPRLDGASAASNRHSMMHAVAASATKPPTSVITPQLDTIMISPPRHDALTMRGSAATRAASEFDRGRDREFRGRFRRSAAVPTCAGIAQRLQPRTDFRHRDYDRGDPGGDGRVLRSPAAPDRAARRGCGRCGCRRRPGRRSGRGALPPRPSCRRRSRE